MSSPFVTHGPQPRTGLPRYKNDFRWRVMPPEKAESHWNAYGQLLRSIN